VLPPPLPNSPRRGAAEAPPEVAAELLDCLFNDTEPELFADPTVFSLTGAVYVAECGPGPAARLLCTVSADSITSPGIGDHRRRLLSAHDSATDEEEVAVTESDERRGSGEPPGDPSAPLDFDPYRFGKPDYYVAPEYRPPGYVPPEPETTPTGYTPPPPYAPTQSWQPSPPPPYGPGGPAQPGSYPPPPGQYPPPSGPYPPPSGNYPPPYYGPGRPATNGKATAALVLGIASIVLCFLTLLDLPVVVLAIVFGALGRRDAARLPGQPGRGNATAGIVCGIVGAVLVGILLAVFLTKYRDCLGLSPGDVQSCMDRHT
jgi:hypothetical protein